VFQIHVVTVVTVVFVFVFVFVFVCVFVCVCVCVCVVLFFGMSVFKCLFHFLFLSSFCGSVLCVPS